MITRRSWAGLVHGVAELEPTGRGLRPHRLPAEVRRRFPDPQLLAMESQPSGVRIAALTAATRIELSTHATRIAYRGADRPRGRIDVVVDGALLVSDELTGGDATEVDLRTGAVEQHAGDAHLTVVDLPPAGERVVELWLPHNEGLELIGLRADAPLVPAPPRRPVWLHHGSSISHGSDAPTPTGTGRSSPLAGGVELRNLGFGGSALVDRSRPDHQRHPADLISLKLGINVVNLDADAAAVVRARRARIPRHDPRRAPGHPAAAGVADLLRHPRGHARPGRDRPSTLGADQVRFIAHRRPGGSRRRAGSPSRVIREVLRDVVAARSDDPHLHYLDGLTLFGAADAERLPLPDALHPGAEAHLLIGERFARIALTDAGVLAG